MSKIIKKYRLDPNAFSNEKDPDTTVCIVGKSPSLIGSGLGESIDSHDIVVRINPWNDSYGNKSSVDRGKKTNHITSSPYHIMRECEQKGRALPHIRRELSFMTDSGDHKKTLYITRIPDESWFRYVDNGCFLGREHGERTIHQKLWGYEAALNLCKEFGVTMKLVKQTSVTRLINDLMVYFNTGINNSHGVLSGTETVLYYMEHFKNVSVAGFSWSPEEYKLCETTCPGLVTQTEYDLFFLNEALNRGLITKLEDKKIKNDYKDIHLYEKIHKKDSGYGNTGGCYVKSVLNHVNKYNPKSILDFGCGKGKLKTGLAKHEIDIDEYDPAIPNKKKIPKEQYDLITTTDVLEHIYEDEIPTICKEFISLQPETMFHAICTRAAHKKLPDGTNAHKTIRDIEWWAKKLQEHTGYKAEVLQDRKGLVPGTFIVILTRGPQ